MAIRRRTFLHIEDRGRTRISTNARRQAGGAWAWGVADDLRGWVYDELEAMDVRTDHAAVRTYEIRRSG